VESGDVGERLGMKALAMKRFYVTVALDPEAPVKQFEQYLLAVIGYLGAERATVVLDTRDGMVAVSWASSPWLKPFGSGNQCRIGSRGCHTADPSDQAQE
jgi:hypothetical protein